MGVRREKIVVEIDDRFSAGAMRVAAAAQLIARELDAIDKNGRNASSSMNRNAGSTNRYATQLQGMNTHLRETNTLLGNLNGNGRNGLGGFNNNANNAGRSINQLTGRLRLFVDLAAALGPALVPIGALGAPALSGIASQLGIAAAAGATTILAFNGVADAFKAVGKAAEAPSFENIQAAKIAMEGLAPATQRFVTNLQEMRGEFAGFRNAAAQPMFKQINRDFDHMEGLLDRLTPVVNEFGRATGKMLGDGLTSLDSERWQDFYTFLEAEAGPAMKTMGETLGNFGHGLAELWMGMDPFNDSFSAWMLNVSASFDGWAAGLAQTEGFTDFLDYVKTTGPQVGDTMGAMGNAFLQIAEAMAPIGGPVLGVLEDVFDVIGNIADSDIGTPLLAGAAAMAVLSRSAALFGATSRTMVAQQAALRGRIAATGGAFRAFGADVRAASNFGAMNAAQMNAQTAAAARVRASLARVGRAAMTGGAGIGFMVAAMSDADDKMGVANTTMLGFMGAMAGPWGAAIGLAVGATMDFAAANNDLEDTLANTDKALRSGGPDQYRAQLAALRSEMVEVASDAHVFENMFNGGINSFTDIGNAIQGGINQFTDGKGRLLDDVDQMKAALDNPGLGSVFASSIDMTADSFNNATRSAADFAASLEKVNSILSGRANMRDYAASLREAAAAFEENGKNLDVFTEKGEANQAALDNIAATALKAAERFEGMEQINFLDKARDNFVDVATKMGMTEKGAGRLATTLGLLNKTKVRPEVDVDTGKANTKVKEAAFQLSRFGGMNETATALLRDLASGGIKGVQGLVNKFGMTRAEAKALLNDLASGKINAAKANLASFDGRSATAYITTVHRTVMGPSPLGAGGPRMTRAEGGPVFGPGTKTSDSIPAMLSNGEFVIKAEAVDHYGLDAMFALNAKRLAGGGSANGATGSAASLSLRGIRDAERELAGFIGALGSASQGLTLVGQIGLGAGRGRKESKLTRGFDLTGDLGVQGIRSEMKEFERVLKEAGYRTGKHFDKLGDRAEGLTKRWLKADKELEALKSASSEVRSAAMGSFNNDPFGNGLAGLGLQLEADRNDSNTMASLLKQLSGKGLDGALYDALSGSGDINTAQQLLAAGKGGISQYERLYADRAGAQRNLGNVATKDYTADIKAQTRVMEKLDRKLDKLEERIEAGAYKGTKAGAEGKDRNRARETRQRARGNR